MPVFIAALWGALLPLAGSLVGRILVALGISVLTYTGVDAALDFAKVQAIQHIQSLPSQVVGMLSVMGVGRCISIIFSAMVAKQVFNGFTAGSVKKFVVK